MRMATCISAYGFMPFYLLILVTALCDLWKRTSVPILLFVGAKLNALLFYHIMEFTSATPPPNL